MPPDEWQPITVSAFSKVRFPSSIVAAAEILLFLSFPPTTLTRLSLAKSAVLGFLSPGSVPFLSLRVSSPRPPPQGRDRRGDGRIWRGNIFSASCTHIPGRSVSTKLNRTQGLSKLASNLPLPRTPGTQRSLYCHLVDTCSNATWNGFLY